jgi:hypothetical protein
VIVRSPDRYVAITNVKNKQAETELALFAGEDLLLDSNEASAYRAARGAAADSDVYELAGGRQRRLEKPLVAAQYHDSYPSAPGSAQSMRDYPRPQLEKGDFHIDGVGAGRVYVGKSYWVGLSYTKPTELDLTWNFHFDCGLMSRDFLRNEVAAATLVIARKGWKNERGSKLSEIVSVPLAIVTVDPGMVGNSMGGAIWWAPENKFLAASVSTAQLKRLAGTGKQAGVEFYAILDLHDGRRLPINKDGVPFLNFDVSRAELVAPNPG